MRFTPPGCEAPPGGGGKRLLLSGFRLLLIHSEFFQFPAHLPEATQGDTFPCQQLIRSVWVPITKLPIQSVLFSSFNNLNLSSWSQCLHLKGGITLHPPAYTRRHSPASVSPVCWPGTQANCGRFTSWLHEGLNRCI